MTKGSKVAIFLGLTLSLIGLVWGVSNMINANSEVDATFKECIAEAGYEYCRTEVCDHRDKPERTDCVGRMIKAYDELYAEAYDDDGGAT